MSRALVAMTMLLVAAVAHAAVVTDAYRHMGVASCSASNCHGKATKRVIADRPGEFKPWLNEYRIWRAQDYHARSFKTLASPASKLIAQKLGLVDAQKAALCLDCHASNVPQAKRGPKFQLADGVGCESCHGGSERWLDSHDNEGMTHAQNVKNGMYPADDPQARAALCLTCHMGTGSKFTTHQVMAAGHPRLYFEVENFTINQPPHYDIKKEKSPRANLWLIGQFETGNQFLTLLQSAYLTRNAWTPDFALFDCQACHHAVDTNPEPADLRWTLARRAQGLTPGLLRVQDQHFQMLLTAAEVVAPGEAGTLRAQVAGLVRAGQQSPAALTAAARSLQSVLNSRRAAWSSRPISAETARAIRKRLLNEAGSGRIQDYATAEIGLVSIQTLTEYIGDDLRLRAELNRLFEGLTGSAKFRPATYAAAARNVASRF